MDTPGRGQGMSVERDPGPSDVMTTDLVEAPEQKVGTTKGFS